ncbi:MAG: universal stress protein [Micropruina glycogenica]|jgi:nucleotide-binding universal stress UspA family protein|uniref:UspA domain-containing protein n=1 Tax=Micropruina glycogenica TaxID=75385 RepID=A0A2N9JIE5_9ACTN|nr:universal stress protein [Micropruina glycogenica]SPD87556.1 conserved protein of unknown function [Micropruina glycogenica]
MTMKDYRTIVVGTDGSALAEPTVGRAAWLAKHDDADLVIVCAYSTLSRRDEAKNVATLGGDSRTGQVLGRTAAGQALSTAVQVAADEGATVTGALLVDGEAAEALIDVADDHGAELIVLGAVRDTSLATRLLGSTAEEVTRRVSCDVLIVRPELGETEFEVPEDPSL